MRISYNGKRVKTFCKRPLRLTPTKTAVVILSINNFISNEKIGLITWLVTEIRWQIGLIIFNIVNIRKVTFKYTIFLSAKKNICLNKNDLKHCLEGRWKVCKRKIAERNGQPDENEFFYFILRLDVCMVEIIWPEKRNNNERLIEISVYDL